MTDTLFEMNDKGDVLFLHADMREALKALPENSVDSVVTDPPYHLQSIVKRFGAENAAPAQFGKDGAFARASKGFMGKCYHPDTEILTEDGWKRVDDVGVGDVIATLDPSTTEIVWQPTARAYRYAFDGDLIAIRHRSALQLVTPNHSVYASGDAGTTYSLLSPDELPRSFHLLAQGVNKSGVASDSVTLHTERPYGRKGDIINESKTYNTKALLRFLGVFLGDGCAVNRANDHPANDFFVVRVKKERKVVFIRGALTALGIKFTETKSSITGYTAFYCYDFVLLHILKPLGKAKDKYIPEWVFKHSADQLEELYLGMMETDGCRQGKYQEIYCTVSARLADGFQRVCFLTGRSAALRMSRKVSPFGESELWTACVLQKGKKLYAERKGRRGNPDAVIGVPYKGDVCCVEVEKHHVIYTRLNGKPVWSGNSWDGGDIAFQVDTWREVMRVLKPGGHLAAFGGTRTFHRMACAIEDAGFEIRDTLMWVYGTGFPKSHDVSKGIDKAAGAEREIVEIRDTRGDFDGKKRCSTALNTNWRQAENRKDVIDLSKKVITAPSTDSAKEWQGWGTSMKPALEPVILARKPLSEKTVAANVLRWRTGAVNIDGCRIPASDKTPAPVGEYSGSRIGPTGHKGARDGSSDHLGRWPANLVIDGSDEVVAMFPSSSVTGKRSGKSKEKNVEGTNWLLSNHKSKEYPGDSGSAARFFYAAKASKADRAGSRHPTVKPIALMRWLTRLITPPGGLVLDPFAGSGTTGAAALEEGMRCLLIEREAEYADDIRRRLSISDIGLI